MSYDDGYIPLDDIELAFWTFQLSSAEIVEANIIRQKLKSGHTQWLEGVAEKTYNAGVQYLMLEHPKLLSSLLKNGALDFRVVAMFLLHSGLESFFSMNSGKGFGFLIDAALRNPSVVSDVKLFYSILSSAIFHGYLNIAYEQTRYQSTLYYSLFYTSTAEDGETNDMSVETLLVIMNYIGGIAEDDFFPTVVEQRDKILQNRGDDIREWIQGNMPDYVDLPLSWVLNSIDLYIDLDDWGMFATKLARIKR
jgi:hypothetical protein